MNWHYLCLASLTIAALSPAGAWAQATDSQAISANEQAQAAIQAQITQGISQGTLSPEQIEALQAQQQALQAGTISSAGTLAGSTALGQVGTPTGEVPRSLQGSTGSTGQAGQLAPTTQVRTGPDPFTYNSLGPDAYQSQKYQNPEYNVPSYPTTNPVPAGEQQQYTQPSSGGYGSGGVVGVPNNGGVYVYKPGSGR